MLNSTAVVGVSVPALGTPERDAVRIVLLDRMVDANLIYLDALRLGLDRDPRYRRDIDRLTLGLLADMQRMAMQSDITVTDEEIMNFYNTQIAPGEELTEDGKTQIEAVLRKDKVHVNAMQLRSKLREGIDINIFQKNFDPAGDEGRADDVPVVEAGGVTITWGEAKSSLIAAGIAATDQRTSSRTWSSMPGSARCRSRSISACWRTTRRPPGSNWIRCSSGVWTSSARPA